MADETDKCVKYEIKFVESRKMDLRGYTLIEGFPGMGLVGTICAKYLVEKLNFEEMGYIDSAMFVPIIRIHNGLPIHPSRIYINTKMKLVVLVSEQVIPQQYTDTLAKSVVRWIEEKKIVRIISLSGIKASPETGDEKLMYGIASNNETKKMLKDYDIEVIKEGITTGVTALILLGLKDKKIDAFSVMGNVETAADYKAASEVLKKLSEILKFTIDVEPLLKEAKDTEEALIKHFKDIKTTGEKVRSLENVGETQPPMYT